MNMILRRPGLTRAMVWTLTVAVLLLGSGPPESLALLAPPDLVAPGTGLDPGRTEDLTKVQQVLESKLIRQRLEDIGFTTEEINSRMARISDAQLHELAMQIDAVMPGGDPSGVGIVVAVIVIVILVVILIWLLDHKVAIEKK